MTTQSATRLVARIDATNPNHHLWLNHGTWWIHYTLELEPGLGYRLTPASDPEPFDTRKELHQQAEHRRRREAEHQMHQAARWQRRRPAIEALERG